MKIKHLFIGIALTANLFAATAQEVKKTYFVSKPGTLISMMTEEEANQVTHLTLTGKINAVDFRHLRDEFKNLQVLDIANASISMYSGKKVPIRISSIFICRTLFRHTLSVRWKTALPKENQL